ncbi:hypothetical protein [Roseibium album]|uniref:VHL beta domain-containing protein n=1 Tax=Roseibium album TaxID=311410 RepID=UPI00391CA07C
MRLVAACSFDTPVTKSRLLAACSVIFLTCGTSALAQSVPETVRVNVEPSEPGIRSIAVNKQYRPIISRDDKGVVIDTMGSNNKLPPCDVKLEVTLENSRILHRDADLCSGSTLVVDVSSDGKPGATARIVGTSSGVSAGPVANAPADTGASQTSTPSVQQSGQSDEQAVAEVSPSSESGGLQPLEQVDTPISASDPNNPAGTPGSTGDFETTVRESLSGGAGNTQAILVSPADGREWESEPGGQPGSISTLQHTVPQTDNRDFRADCTTQSGFAKITFQQAPAGLQEGMPQAIRVTAGDYSATFNAFGSSNANEAGISLPEVNIEMTDPLWEAMIRQSELSIAVEGLQPYPVSLGGSANPIRLFVATCSLPQQIVGDGAFGEDPGSDLSCSELGRVRSVEAVQPGQIVFRNSGRQPVEVHWVDYRGGERPYARLEAGQILEQQTYVSHAWTVRGANGECRGIYVTQSPYREVVIGGSGTFGNTNAGGFGGSNSGQGGFQGDQFGNGIPNGPVPPGSVGGDNQPNFQQQAARTNVADYLCTAGIDLNVVFSPDGQSATVAEMGYGAVTLERFGSANTFHYEGQGHILKGQLQNATWTRPGLRDVFCARR